MKNQNSFCKNSKTVQTHINLYNRVDSFQANMQNFLLELNKRPRNVIVQGEITHIHNRTIANLHI